MHFLELAYSKDFILISLSTFDYFTGLQLIAYWKPVNESWLVLCSEFANIFFISLSTVSNFVLLIIIWKTFKKTHNFPFFNLISHRGMTFLVQVFLPSTDNLVILFSEEWVNTAMNKRTNAHRSQGLSYSGGFTAKVFIFRYTP